MNPPQQTRGDQEGPALSTPHNYRDGLSQAPRHRAHQPSNTRNDYNDPNLHRDDYPNPELLGPGGRNLNEDSSMENSRDLAHRDRPRVHTSNSTKREQRTCAACEQPLTGQFVRALNGTFHLECFRCRVKNCLDNSLSLLTNMA
jgi:hypothetical protein